MRAIERVIVLLAIQSIVEAKVRSRKGPWLIDLTYRHVTATLIFDEGYATENPLGEGDAGSLVEGPDAWRVPGGTSVEIASFLTGWMIGRTGTTPEFSEDQLTPAPDQTTGHRNEHTLHASEWFSLSAFHQGQHHARSGPDA